MSAINRSISSAYSAEINALWNKFQTAPEKCSADELISGIEKVRNFMNIYTTTVKAKGVSVEDVAFNKKCMVIYETLIDHFLTNVSNIPVANPKIDL